MSHEPMGEPFTEEPPIDSADARTMAAPRDEEGPVEIGGTDVGAQEELMSSPADEIPADFRDIQAPADFRDRQGPADFRDRDGPIDFRDRQGPADFRDRDGPIDFRDREGPLDFRDENHPGRSS